MESLLCIVFSNLIFVLLLLAICRFPDCYDPLDPNGNITVTFDILQYTSDGYVASVTIHNFYQYRHVDKPGWRLGWTWSQNEVIWSMSGAFATHQGNCTSFKFQTPHSSKKDPDILDLMPDALPQNRSEACCKGGILDAWAMNPSKSFSSFERVGNLGGNSTGYRPLNLTLLAPGPGYTCSLVVDTDPTVSSVIGDRRQGQVYSKNLISILNFKSLAASEGNITVDDSLVSVPSFNISKIGAAIAYVAGLLKVPAIFIKAVTDIIDGDKPTSEEFLQNLAAVTAALDLAVTQIVDYINAKCLAEL